MANLEDGEISDEDTSSNLPIAKQSDDSEDEIKPSVAKSMKLSKSDKNASKSKKYNIWSQVLQEESLTTTLNNIDVVNSDLKVERSVESYDYSNAINDTRPSPPLPKTVHDPLGFIYSDENLKTNKEKEDSEGEDEKTGKNAYTKLCLTDSNGFIVNAIANDLKEPKIALLYKVVQTLGKEKTFKLFYETEKIEKNGGIMIASGSRRRTPGGVFFYQIRGDKTITKLQKSKIFDEEDKKLQELRSRKRNNKSEYKNSVEKEMKKLGETVVHVDLSNIDK